MALCGILSQLLGLESSHTLYVHDVTLYSMYVRTLDLGLWRERVA